MIISYLLPAIGLALGGAGLALAQDTVSVPGPDGLPIKAWHYKPTSDGIQAKPVVIALHGCGGLYATTGGRKGLLNARHHAMGEMLAQQGYHAVFPDSFGSRGIETICGPTAQSQNGIKVSTDERRADTLATLAWVRTQPWADTAAPRNHVALLGWSHGAMTLLATTDANHNAAKAAGEPFKTAIAFYPGCVTTDRQGYRPNTPLTMLLGADDDWTLPGPCIKMAERLQKLGDQVTIKVYPDAVHDFDTPVPGLRTRNEIPSNSPARAGLGVLVGQNPAARADSWQRVRDILKLAFQY
jgi:dienelactone hydrolase